MTAIASIFAEGAASQDTLLAALEAGESPNIRLRGGMTPLANACEDYVNPDIVELLLKYGAEVDARDSSWATTLMSFLESEKFSAFSSDDWRGGSWIDPDDSFAKRYLRVFHLLLDHGADVNAQDDQGRTPLAVCAEYQTITYFIYQLLEHGADPDLVDNTGRSPLTVACERHFSGISSEEERSVVSLLADFTCKELPPSRDGLTPMMAAIHHGNDAAIDDLKANGYAVRVTPPFDYLEPVVAVINNDLEWLRYLLQNGYSLEAKTYLGRTPLITAAHLGHQEIAAFLLDAGANIEAEVSLLGTALFAAVSSNHLEMCKLLLERGAEPIVQGRNVIQFACDLNDNDPQHSYFPLCQFLWNTVDEDTPSISGATAAKLRQHDPLSQRRKAKHYADNLKDLIRTNTSPKEIIAALKAGTSANILVRENVTALMYLCDKYMNAGLVAALLGSGAKINARDKDKQTQLMRFLRDERVCRYGRSEEGLHELQDLDNHDAYPVARVFRVLLDHGADVDVQDKDGTTPLILCAGNHRHTFFVDGLLEQGADTNIVDHHGYSPLIVACLQPNYLLESETYFPLLDQLVDRTSPSVCPADDGMTPMIAAIKGANVNTVQTLVAAGYKIDLTPPFAYLEPTAAVLAGDLERLRHAIRNGYSLKPKDERHWAPLMLAARLGKNEFLEYLLDAGANLESRAPIGNTQGTALNAAVFGNHIETCQLLLDRGAKTRHSFGSVLNFALKLDHDTPSGRYREMCHFLWGVIEDKSIGALVQGAAIGLPTPYHPL